MKLITAVIRPERLEFVSRDLEAAGCTGLTTTEVQGRGVQGGRTEYYRGQAVRVAFRSKVKVEVLVADETLDSALQLVVDAARTGDSGEVGDGKVWVTDVASVIRVRTGESGPAAI